MVSLSNHERHVLDAPPRCGLNRGGSRAQGVVVAHLLPKQRARVRFPLGAPVGPRCGWLPNHRPGYSLGDPAVRSGLSRGWECWTSARCSTEGGSGSARSVNAGCARRGSRPSEASRRGALMRDARLTLGTRRFPTTVGESPFLASETPDRVGGSSWECDQILRSRRIAWTRTHG